MSAGRLIVSVSQDTAAFRVDSQHVEVSARHELHFYLLDIAARVYESVRGPRQAQDTRQSRKHIRALLCLAIKRIGEEVPALIWKTGGPPYVPAVAKQDQLLRLVHRQRLDQHGIEQTKDRSVRSDPERQRQHCDES